MYLNHINRLLSPGNNRFDSRFTMKKWHLCLFILLVFLYGAPASHSVSFAAQPPSQHETEGGRKDGPFDMPDWEELFVPEKPLLEIFIRGTIIYLGLFVMLRVLMKREAGSVGMTDMLVIVLLADASQNAMAGNYDSIIDGIFLVATIIFWSYALNLLGFFFPKIEKFIHPPALLLIKNGRIIRNNLRKEFITEEELMSQVRSHGCKSIEEVHEAYIEMDGRISVIPKKRSK